MGVFPLLDRRTPVVRGIHHFPGQPLGHGELRARTRGVDQPADGKRLPAVVAHLDGNLIGGAADTAGAHLDFRLHVVQGVVEHPHRVLRPALADAIERTVHDAFGDRLLAVVHQAVHELAENDIAELRIGQNFALFGAMTARHAYSLLAYFGSFDQYFDPSRRRSLTPWASRLPRM